MIKALIFDFDGLILETETPCYESWKEVYDSYGCKLPLASWVTLIGGASEPFDPYAELERQVGHAVDRGSITPSRRKRENEAIEKQPILPGVLQYLEDAKALNLKIGLASSSSCEWVTQHLKRLGIYRYFDIIQARNDVKQVKPNPELYQKVLDMFHLDPKEGIVLEDSPNGIRAAKEAGLFCVAIPNNMTCDLSLEQADLRLNSLTDMPLKDVIALAEDHNKI